MYSHTNLRLIAIRIKINNQLKKISISLISAPSHNLRIIAYIFNNLQNPFNKIFNKFLTYPNRNILFLLILLKYFFYLVSHLLTTSFN